jgi:GH24 family phage-related lysozyme (muramidase)
MKISDKGLSIIKEFEGYARRLPNGNCAAYQDYLGNGKYDIPTIGWGCTEGVKMGDVWTRKQAEDALRKELTRFENAVTKLCKFKPTQNQFDALVSFAYNVGEGGLAKSSVLRLANSGDFVGASRAFNAWTKAQGVTLPGLVKRRHMEAALFLSDSVQNDEPAIAPDEPSNQLQQSSTISWVSKARQTIVAVGAAVGGLFTMDTWNLGKDMIGTLKGFWTDHQLIIILLALGAAYLVFQKVHTNREQEAADGRYAANV